MSRAKSHRKPETKRTARKAKVTRGKAVATSAVADLALSLTDTAKAIDKPDATIHDWVVKESLPAQKIGGKLMIRVIELAKFLAHRGGYAPESQRERLAREQADKISLENAQRRSDLIDAQTVGEALKTIASSVSGQLEAIPSRCANEFSGISDPVRIHARLREEHRAVRTTMAGIIGRLAETCEGIALDADSVDAAAVKNGGSVGGRETGIAERVGGTGSVPKHADALHDPDRSGGGKSQP